MALALSLLWPAGPQAHDFERTTVHLDIDTDGRLVWNRVHREYFRDKPTDFDLRGPGKIFMGEYAKFIASRNVLLGSSGQLESVRESINNG